MKLDLTPPVKKIFVRASNRTIDVGIEDWQSTSRASGVSFQAKFDRATQLAEPKVEIWRLFFANCDGAIQLAKHKVREFDKSWKKRFTFDYFPHLQCKMRRQNIKRLKASTMNDQQR